MSLQGLPDFQQPLQAEGLQILYPYEGFGTYVLMPDALEIAKAHDGRPEFVLEMVRGQMPFLPPKPYGLLDFRVWPSYRLETGLAVLRQQHPGAQLTPASFLPSAFLHFELLANQNESPTEFLKPIPLTWNGLGTARLNQRLSEQSAGLLKQSLTGELLSVRAVVELETMGVAPRLPLQISFDPAQLLEALRALGSPERGIARQAIVEYFKSDSRSLPLTIEGELDSSARQTFAEVMADRVRQRFGTFTPSPEPEGGVYYLLPAPAEIGSGQFKWDLSQPILTPRPLTLMLNPFTAAQQLVQAEGVEAVLKQTVVPAIPTGFQRVSTVVNLPEQRLGILDLGVTLRVEPSMPYRPQAQVKTVSLQDNNGSAPIDLRFSAGEEARYNVFTYVVVKDAGGIEELTGESKPQRGDSLYLRPDDFPVEFVPVEASQALLEIAEVQGILKRPDDQGEVQESFSFSLAQPLVTLALPRETLGATLEFEARSRAGLGSIKLGPLPARPMQFGLPTFREYGLQQVEVTCIFETLQRPVIFEFLPEGRAETRDEIKLLSFRPGASSQILSWLPVSLFQYHYRYRRRAAQSEALGPWSDYCEPSEPLIIHV